MSLLLPTCLLLIALAADPAAADAAPATANESSNSTHTVAGAAAA